METDSAWAEIIDMQLMVAPPSRPRENPFNSIFRRKRQDYSGLPPWCHCEPPKVTCGAGKPGPDGPPGPDGGTNVIKQTCI